MITGQLLSPMYGCHNIQLSTFQTLKNVTTATTGASRNDQCFKWHASNFNENDSMSIEPTTPTGYTDEALLSSPCTKSRVQRLHGIIGIRISVWKYIFGANLNEALNALIDTKAQMA